MYDIKAILSITSNDKKYIRSLARTLEPDNVDIPENMYIELKTVEKEDRSILFFNIKTIFTAKKFDSIRGTLDEVLSIIEVIDDTLTMLK